MVCTFSKEPAFWLIWHKMSLDGKRSIVEIVLNWAASEQNVLDIGSCCVDGRGCCHSSLLSCWKFPLIWCSILPVRSPAHFCQSQSDQQRPIEVVWNFGLVSSYYAGRAGTTPSLTCLLLSQGLLAPWQGWWKSLWVNLQIATGNSLGWTCL